MNLPGTVEGAKPSLPGFDSDTAITAQVAQQCYASGYKFCIRYLSLGPQSAGDLDAQEATNILSAGLALMPVQHVRASGWSPKQSVGQQDGLNAATNAKDIGFPEGINIWCDLEGVNRSAQAQDVIDYCGAWYQAVNSAGYIPGLYVGAACVLTGQQLFGLPFQHYWRSQSNVPEIPTRSYQMLQLFPPVFVNGIWVDVDITQTDKLGSQPQWLRVSG
jgi:Domain of unknown function (DUF1906)